MASRPHRRDVRASLLNSLAVGDRVVFEVIEDKLAGPRAVRVNRAPRKERARPRDVGRTLSAVAPQQGED